MSEEWDKSIHEKVRFCMWSMEARIVVWISSYFEWNCFNSLTLQLFEALKYRVPCDNLAGGSFRVVYSKSKQLSVLDKNVRGSTPRCRRGWKGTPHPCGNFEPAVSTRCRLELLAAPPVTCKQNYVICTRRTREELTLLRIRRRSSGWSPSGVAVVALRTRGTWNIFTGIKLTEFVIIYEFLFISKPLGVGKKSSFRCLILCAKNYPKPRENTLIFPVRRGVNVNIIAKLRHRS